MEGFGWLSFSQQEVDRNLYWFRMENTREGNSETNLEDDSEMRVVNLFSFN